MNPDFGPVDIEDEPVSLELAYAHLAIDAEGSPPVSPFDLWLTEVGIPGAREAAENYTGRAFAPQTATYRYDSFDQIEPIRVQPFGGIASISYKDENGATQTVSDYTVATDRYGDVTIEADWPAGSEVEIVVNVGGAAPKAAVNAILLILGHTFKNRESVTDRQAFELPMGAIWLLNPYRVRLGIG